VLTREQRDAYSLDRAMRAVVREFEVVIREFPSQWFQFTPFWNATPATRKDPADSAPPADRPPLSQDDDSPVRRGVPR
jgi:hypothetical protein